MKGAAQEKGAESGQLRNVGQRQKENTKLAFCDMAGVRKVPIRERISLVKSGWVERYSCWKGTKKRAKQGSKEELLGLFAKNYDIKNERSAGRR